MGPRVPRAARLCGRCRILGAGAVSRAKSIDRWSEGGGHRRVSQHVGVGRVQPDRPHPRPELRLVMVVLGCRHELHLCPREPPESLHGDGIRSGHNHQFLRRISMDGHREFVGAGGRRIRCRIVERPAPQYRPCRIHPPDQRGLPRRHEVRGELFRCRGVLRHCALCQRRSTAFRAARLPQWAGPSHGHRPD